MKSGDGKQSLNRMFVQFAHGKQSPSHLLHSPSSMSSGNAGAKLSKTELNFCCFRENCFWGCPVGKLFLLWKMCFCCFYICFLFSLSLPPGGTIEKRLQEVADPFSSTLLCIYRLAFCVHSNKFHERNCFQKRKSIF